jgi:signal transduction histidine kinase
VTISVGEVDDTLRFELAGEALGADFDRLQDRVEALGGSLAIESEPGRIRLSGSLPPRK